jgi:thiol-disulfide isomerase/thioredoxin
MRLFALPAIALLGACGHAAYPASAAHALLGKPLPAIHHRTTLDGQPFDGSQLAGRPVLVKFFADYCKPCKDSLPAAQRVYQAHPDIAFVGVDEDESAALASAVVQRYGLTFPVIHDESNVLSGRFRVANMPMTFVADAAGVVRWVGDETQTEDDLRRAVEAAR